MLVSAAAVMALCSPLQALPIVPNGDFETGANGSPPPNWQGNASFPIASDSVLISAGTGVGGSSSAAFSVLPNNPNAGMDSDLISGFTPGNPYVLGFQLRGNTNLNTLFVNIFDDTHTTFTGLDFQFNLGAFTHFEVPFTPTTATSFVEFFLPTGATGADIFVDDVTITAAPEMVFSAGTAPFAFAFCLLALGERRRTRLGAGDCSLLGQTGCG